MSVWLTVGTMSIRADEGMWLLQLMQEQHSVDIMKEQGLNLEAEDLYNPVGVSLKDAVGIFGGGCTGEIISPEGLILTNHHCGYSFIQQLSSVEKDYLTEGFWAMNRREELPAPGLKFTLIRRIEDITARIQKDIREGTITEVEALGDTYLKRTAKDLLEASDLSEEKGIDVQALPFYAGNKYYLIYRKVYTDIRMVAAPPSSVGKFGGETDNWMWPRHTGDFSIFRIYADANGEPADHNENNIPLQTPKHLVISLKGMEEGDYAMILGFPGSTSRYLTVSEVKERMDAINTPRILIREARQQILREEMEQSDKIRIQYANKYTGSSNYWKNSIGMNKAIVDNKVLETKAEQEKEFYRFAQEQNSKDYQEVVDKIDELVAATSPLIRRRTLLTETFRTGIEFGAPHNLLDQLLTAMEKGEGEEVASLTTQIEDAFDKVHNKDYDHEVDRRVALTLIPLYARRVEKEYRLEFYEVIEKEYGDDMEAFINRMYDHSLFSDKERLEKFLEAPSANVIENDPAFIFRRSVTDALAEINEELSPLTNRLALLHKTYIRGLGEMKLPIPSYPDANFTIRLTYGNVFSYKPRDGVHYRYYTTADGILEKEDPENREFQVPARLKELILERDFGPYAQPDGSLPVCFLTNNDITGGNSGSPVMNGNGELIGCAFDGNWESLSGDINFDPEKQRCINVDIRYILFLIDKLGGCKHLIDEMTVIY
ncbi:MAG: S46 family peptidase [Bacteroides sp.]|nr:S46 family peptidase [Bacteroides sp.]